MIFVGQIFLFSDKLVSNDMAQKRKDSKNTFYSAERMNRDLTWYIFANACGWELIIGPISFQSSYNSFDLIWFYNERFLPASM